MRPVSLLLSLIAAVTLTGCDLAGDILEFGFWSGVLVVALVVGVIWLVARQMRGRGGRP